MMPLSPLVGITGRRRPASILGAPQGFTDAPLDVYFAEYATSVVRAGGVPVFIPLDTDIAQIMPRLDALVIAGGEDVDPARYGAEPAPETGPCSPDRDELEFTALGLAHEAGIPVLGVCRGHQVINVAFGGTLIQHLDGDEGPRHLPLTAPRAAITHRVTLDETSVHASVWGIELGVNSFHHQAVATPGEGLKVVGWAEDGTIEAIEHEDGRILGVQWHPETFDADPIFRWVVDTAREIAEQKNDTQEVHHDEAA